MRVVCPAVKEKYQISVFGRDLGGEAPRTLSVCLGRGSCQLGGRLAVIRSRRCLCFLTRGRERSLCWGLTACHGRERLSRGVLRMPLLERAMEIFLKIVSKLGPFRTRV